MKLTFLLITIGSLTISANTFSQTERIGGEFKDVSIREILDKIENETDYKFFYLKEQINDSRKLNFKSENLTVPDFLDLVFSEKEYKYKIFDNKIVVVTPLIVEKQEIIVKGKITDTEGNPLPGVNVVEKGTTNGAVTNLDGDYTISVSSPDATLSFSYVGFLTEEMAVAGQTNVDLKMVEDIQSLEEVVVVGYGTMKRSDITGSVASVKAETLEEMSVSRVDQALQGRLSGVSVQNTSAEPNAKVTIRIRGANSINGENTPLIVIDGFQGGDLNILSPGDIESIEVLKDASATAIYGSRGANGVILVTTKSGKKGDAVISYDSYYSAHQVRKTIDVLDAAQYAEVINENRTEFGLDPVFSDSEIVGLRSAGGTNWQDEVFRRGFSHNQLVSIRGGNENLSYYVSGGLVDTKGIVLNTSYNRYNLRSNITSQLNDKIKVDLNIYLSREEDHPTALHSYGATNYGSPIYSSLVFAPTKPIYDEDGNYTMPGGGYGSPTIPNPVALAKEPIRNNYGNTMSVTGGIEYNLAQGLTLNISGGYKLLDSENNAYYNSVPTGASGSESAEITNTKRIILQNTNMITYNKLINDSHNLTFTGVFEQQVEQYNNNWAGAQGFFTNTTTYNNLGLGDNPQIPSSSEWGRTLESFMGRINYSYNNKYMLTLTGRADASSVFGTNNKWGYFPSAALGWNVTSEEFMSGARNIVSLLKIRASYGITGNQAVSPYKTLGLLNTDAPYPIDGESLSVGASLGDLANPDLEWEKTEQLNIGTDLRFFEGRIELIVDYYDKNTKDLLLSVPLPIASGGNAKVLRNVGEVKNEGFELYLGGKPLTGKFKWETGFTLGKNKNEVVALRGDETSYALGDAGLPGFTNARWLQVGQSLGLYKGYVQDGVWKSSEATEAAVYNAFPGAPKFVDQNEDDVIDSEDIVPIANAQPDFTYGWSNTFTYKNFDLNVLIQGVHGNEILNLGRVRMEVSSGDSDATSPRILDRWTPENEDTNVPSFTGQSTFSTLATSRWVEDGSYLRVKDITLGYNLPALVLQKLNIASARIYISGTNLLTKTDYTGFDPEASSGVDKYSGVDLAAYPSQKIYTIGFNLKF